MLDTQAQVFEAAKALLLVHVPPLTVLKDAPGDFQVMSDKPTVVAGRKMPNLWFAGLKANKKDVTLHFLPLYINPKLEESLPALFVKHVKGKACCHLGTFSEELQKATVEALQRGLDDYRRAGHLE